MPGAKLQDAPVFQNFLETTLEYRRSPDDAKLLLEALGYSISDCTKGKTSFFLIGPPSSGKSVILEFIKMILNDDDTTQIPFTNLSNRFEKGMLHNSRVNLCSELSEKGFPQIDIFKAITAGDTMFAEHKGKDGFFFRPKVKLWNAGNVMPVPKYGDGTKAIVERLTFLRFKQSVPREKWNIRMLDELFEERDVICSLAVDTLKELIEKNFAFCIPADSAEYTKFYEESLNSIDVFIEEECEFFPEAMVSSKDFLCEYLAFCDNNLFAKSITMQIFTQKICSLNGVKKERRRVEGDQKMYFIGIQKKNALHKPKECAGKNKKIVFNTGKKTFPQD